MPRIILIILFALFVVTGALADEPHVDTSLLASARKALPSEISTHLIELRLEAGLWNSNRTAIAFTLARTNASVVFIFLRQPGGEYLAVDVSRVEERNLGKLGTTGRSGYTYFQTTPAQWLPRNDGLIQIVMTTRAWQGRQRYSAYEKLLIKPDGTVLWK